MSELVLRQLFEHVRELDAGITVSEALLARADLSMLEQLALSLHHLADIVDRIVTVRKYPAQGKYHG